MAPATDEVEEASAGPEEAAAGEDADEITTQDEVAPLKAASAPTKPSAADVEEHNITHTPHIEAGAIVASKAAALANNVDGTRAAPTRFRESGSITGTLSQAT